MMDEIKSIQTIMEVYNCSLEAAYEIYENKYADQKDGVEFYEQNTHVEVWHHEKA